MAKTISINERLYKEFASYGNRDESHNTILARLLEHIDEDQAQEDRLNRLTTFDDKESGEFSTTNDAVEKIDDGTVVRFRINRGEYAGEERTGTVSGGRVEYNGSTWSPTGMAREADQDIRGSDARSSGAYSGPRELEYQNEEGEWVSLETILE